MLNASSNLAYPTGARSDFSLALSRLRAIWQATWLPTKNIVRVRTPSGAQCRNTQHCGCNSIGRVSAFQAECCEFEPRRPLHARISALVYTELKP